MKKLMLSICLLMGGAVFVNAQQQDTASTQTPTQTETQATVDQDRMQIQVSELPQSIRTSLESTDFAGWTISAAYKLDQSASTKTPTDATTPTQGSTSTTGSSTQSGTSSEVKAAYMVELKNGAETKNVKFDKDGNKLEGEKHSDQK